MLGNIVYDAKRACFLPAGRSKEKSIETRICCIVTDTEDYMKSKYLSTVIYSKNIFCLKRKNVAQIT